MHCYTTVMSSNTRVTRSKGKSDGLSLPARTRQRRKPTNMENDDGDTVLNTTFDAGPSQHHPQMPVHTSPLRCQSTPPWTDAVRMQETPVPAVPAASHRPMTPCILLPRSQYLQYLPLCLQKTDAVPSLMTTWKCAMKKSH